MFTEFGERTKLAISSRCIEWNIWMFFFLDKTKFFTQKFVNSSLFIHSVVWVGRQTQAKSRTNNWNPSDNARLTHFLVFFFFDLPISIHICRSRENEWAQFFCRQKIIQFDADIGLMFQMSRRRVTGGKTIITLRAPVTCIRFTKHSTLHLSAMGNTQKEN